MFMLLVALVGCSGSDVLTDDTGLESLIDTGETEDSTDAMVLYIDGAELARCEGEEMDISHGWPETRIACEHTEGLFYITISRDEDVAELKVSGSDVDVQSWDYVSDDGGTEGAIYAGSHVVEWSVTW